MNTHELSIVSLLHSTVQCQCQWFRSSEQSVSLNICIVLPHLRSIGLHICKFEASLELCSCKKLEYLRHIISNLLMSRTTATSWRWGTWCWLTTWRTSRRPRTRSTTSGSGEKGGARSPSSYLMLLMWSVLSGLTSSERWWEVPGTTGSVK